MCGKTGCQPLVVFLNRFTLFRVFKTTFRLRLFDACLLGELLCRCPVLPDVAPPLRRAPGFDLPVVRPNFGFDMLNS